MDWDRIYAWNDARTMGLDKDEQEAFFQFTRLHNEFFRSDSRVDHFRDGFFFVYDHPAAIAWAKSSSWKPTVHLCNDTSYWVLHFEDPTGAMEMKLRWC